MHPEHPPTGTVVHVELYSEQPEATAAFYQEAFAWSAREPEGTGYTMLEPPAAPMGGLLDRTEAEGEVPATLVYLHAEDVDALCEDLARAGGSVLREPYEVPGMGRMALFQAPGGIVQALWERSEEAPPAAEVPIEPPVGSIFHVELHSDAPEATARVYHDLFGWQFTPLEDTPYQVATLPRPPDGGIMPRQEGPFDPPSTLLYLLVEDVNQALSRVFKAGGTVLGERYEIEAFGAFGIFEAPGGIVQAVWERAP